MKNKPTVRLLAGLFLGTALAASSLGASAGTGELESLRQQIRLLEQRLQHLEQDQKRVPAPEAAPADVRVTAGEKGFGLAARDNSSSLRLKASCRPIPAGI